MKQEEFSKVFRGSPIKRTKLSGLRRNAVIAMGNSRDIKFGPTLAKLSEDQDSIVAESAKWALNQLKQMDLPA
jgi:epoxyqueuosine reductase